MMHIEPTVRSAMLQAIPHLRAFAASLCRNYDGIDDLVQDTLASACANITKFQSGSKMEAWLITILRNRYYSEYRKRRRQVEDIDGVHSQTLRCEPEQFIHVHLAQVRAAVDRLPDCLQYVVKLIGYSGLSYEEAADVCGCSVGTVRSRLHRARKRLAAQFGIDAGEHAEPEPEPQCGVAFQ
jgi:RNA polymerase sigma-70 factor (ECF subfamily)